MRRKILAAALLCACSAQEGGDDSNSDAPPFRVESSQVGSYFEVSLAPSGHRGVAERATGAVHIPILDPSEQQYETAGNPIRATCGVTFITPTHAITAAHCVEAADVPHPDTQTLYVEMFNMDPGLDWANNDALNGSFPDFSSPMNSLGPADGYKSEFFGCKLVLRCGSSWGPMVACNDPISDIAVLECDGDPGTKYGYMNVAADDAPGDPVFMPWKHEVLAANAAIPDHFDHYVDRPGVSPNKFLNNYHYFEEGKLLPLRSKGFAIGDLTLQPLITNTAHPAVTWTTLFGCHGTSGSGILKANGWGHYELLGPVALGAQFGSYLCQQSDLVDPFYDGMGYAKRSVTASVAEKAYCGKLSGSLMLWLDCYLDLFYEEFVPFDPPLVWPCLSCPPFDWLRVMNEPVIVFEGGELEVPFGPTREGEHYRVSVHAMPMERGAGGSMQLLIDGEPVDELEVDELSGKLSADFVARHDEVRVHVLYDGRAPMGLTEFSRVVSGEVNRLDTLADRAGLGLMVDRAGIEPMRFGPDGERGFAAVLGAGETMVVTRQAFTRGMDTWRMTFATDADAEALEVSVYDGLGRGEAIRADLDVRRGVATAYVSGVEHPAGFVVTNHGREGSISIDDIAFDAG